MSCPCCGADADVPAIAIIADDCRLGPIETAILRAVWRGHGHPVENSRIITAMYADDPEGGPENTYRALKVTMHHLRRKLRGSGVQVEHVAYGRGYRLVIGERARRMTLIERVAELRAA